MWIIYNIFDYSHWLNILVGMIEHNDKDAL